MSPDTAMQECAAPVWLHVNTKVLHVAVSVPADFVLTIKAIAGQNEDAVILLVKREG